MKGKVVLINPPSPFLENPKIEPYLGILYLAAEAEQNGFDVSVIDLSGKENYLEIVNKLRADVFGITCVTPQYPYAKKIANELKKKNKQSILVVGGAHPTTLDKETLEETKYDVVVRGEGELTFLELISGLSFQCIDGITYKKSNGEIIRNKERVQKKDIDSFPFPSRHLIPMEEYERKIAGGLATTIITSRGCPYKCKYCDSGVWKRNLRFRSARNVLEEIDKIKIEFGINNLLFIDDTFTIGKERLKEICNGLKEREIKWRCWTRVDQVNQEVLDMMADCGCCEISFGIESGSQKILDAMGKKTTVQQNIDAINMAKKAGIKSKAFLIIGYPSETIQTIQETKDFINVVEPDDWILSTFTPIIGSEVWRFPEENGIINMDKDYGAYWEVGLEGKGGMTIETEQLSSERLDEERTKLLSFLREKIPK